MEKIVDYGDLFGALLTAFSFWLHSAWPYYWQTCSWLSFKYVEYGVPQRFVLGSLLFNIHLCDLLYFLEDLDIASYADDTTIDTVVKENKQPINVLETSSLLRFKCFSINFMKANSGKSHLLLSCSEPSTTVTDSCSTESNKKTLFLGITIDSNLKIDDHVNNLFRKPCQKLNALSRLALFINVSKRRIITKAFVES